MNLEFKHAWYNHIKGESNPENCNLIYRFITPKIYFMRSFQVFFCYESRPLDFKCFIIY